MDNKFKEYEEAKRALQEKNLSPGEYERRLRELARRLNI